MSQQQTGFRVRILALAVAVGSVFGLATWTLRSAPNTGPSLEEGFRNPPMTARPSIYYLLLNGYVNADYADREIEEFYKAGVGGLCVFDMGARGDLQNAPPAGPAFLSPESAKALGRIIRTAKRLGMESSLSVTSSWDMGGSWVEPRDASMTLLSAEINIAGPKAVDERLPFPAVPTETPKGADGMPLYHHEVALIAIPNPQRRGGHEFIFQLPKASTYEVNRAVLYNTGGQDRLFARDFRVSFSETSAQSAAFHEVVHGTLKPAEGPQEFRFRTARAKYVKLAILNGQNPDQERVEMAEFELYTPAGENILISHRAKREIDGTRLLTFTSALGQIGEWSALNIHDGVTSGARGSWSSAGLPPLSIPDAGAVVDLSGKLDGQGHLRWDAPAGKWTLVRYVAINTGEKLKVPSPNSDGLATDHLSAAATRRYIGEVIRRLKPAIGDFRTSGLKDLYLASYEVRGQIWTPGLIDEFRKRRGYDLTPYLPVLRGGLVGGEEASERVAYDFDKTVGELMVDAYYRAAGEVAHEAGLGVESEAGGPGPPIHQVPVDALQALGSVDTVRGEFWPYRQQADALWVIKETAAAAHIYGKRVVHMESFTSSHHWDESFQFLKFSADRAFTEGMNHVVWHTAAHQPPEAGKPGWVYYAGTHITPNRVWWPMAKPFLDYLGRASFLLQQGLPVGDVLYYYGDQSYNFVPPRHVDPSLGFGYDYDVTNPEVILKRLTVRDGKLALPEGITYEMLVLPNRDDIDLAVLQRVGELIDGGATVVGRKPSKATGFAGYPDRDRQVRELAAKIWGNVDGTTITERKYGKGMIVWGRTLKEVMKQRGAGPDFAYESRQPGAELDFVHRRTPEADIYFIRNPKDRWEDVEARFRVAGRQPEIWLADTGEILPYPAYSAVEGGVRVPLRLAPEGSLFVVFHKPASADAIVSGAEGSAIDWQTRVAFEGGSYDIRRADGSVRKVEIAALPNPVEVAGPWQVNFEPDRGAPPAVTLPALASWTENADPGIRYFSGIAEYRIGFELTSDWLAANQRVFLDLGRLWAVGDVMVNGQPLGVVWKKPFRVDVTKAARAGVNDLRVRIANTWANRIIGDARDPNGKHYTRTNVTTNTPASIPWAKYDLIPSGLFGPVRLHAGETLPR